MLALYKCRFGISATVQNNDKYGPEYLSASVVCCFQTLLEAVSVATACKYFFK